MASVCISFKSSDEKEEPIAQKDLKFNEAISIMNEDLIKLEQEKARDKSFRAQLLSERRQRPADDGERIVGLKQRIRLTFTSGAANIPLISTAVHSKHWFVNTALIAFYGHHNLVLSPDDFWLLIAQSVAQHINQDPEKYRRLFVDHEGQRALVVDMDALKDNSNNTEEMWGSVIAKLSLMIKRNIKTGLADAIMQPFSSTGEVEQAVFNGTLMESTKKYFRFGGTMCVCGIPNITLLGTPNDYKSILDRINVLSGIFRDLDWYLNRAAECMEKVYKTACGQIDRDFWECMVCSEPKKERMGPYSPTRLKWLSKHKNSKWFGWLGQLIAYENGCVNSWEAPLFNEFQTYPTSFTDFLLKLVDPISRAVVKEVQMKFMTGFVGVGYDKERNALRPAMGWAVNTWDEVE